MFSGVNSVKKLSWRNHWAFLTTIRWRSENRFKNALAPNMPLCNYAKCLVFLPIAIMLYSVALREGVWTVRFDIIAVRKAHRCVDFSSWAQISGLLKQERELICHLTRKQNSVKQQPFEENHVQTQQCWEKNTVGVITGSEKSG